MSEAALPFFDFWEGSEEADWRKSRADKWLWILKALPNGKRWKQRAARNTETLGEGLNDEG